MTNFNKVILTGCTHEYVETAIIEIIKCNECVAFWAQEAYDSRDITALLEPRKNYHPLITGGCSGRRIRGCNCVNPDKSKPVPVYCAFEKNFKLQILPPDTKRDTDIDITL